MDHIPSVAVISDAVSTGFYFPVWHRYYASQFGERNIYLITYPACSSAFHPYELGGVTELPNTFLDHIRAKAISAYVRFLLQIYDVVIRVDTDEFIIPDPDRYQNLALFVAESKVPYLTGIGVDVIQRPGEPDLDLTQPILITQRSYAYANASLNKTCLTRVPCEWSSGFHGSTLYPHFEGCYLVHLKRADIELQLKWLEFMHPQVEEQFKEYYSPNRSKIEEYHNNVSSRPLRTNLKEIESGEYMEKYLKSVTYNPQVGIYHGDHFHDPFLTQIPKQFINIV